jgi:hypothetical protein
MEWDKGRFILIPPLQPLKPSKLKSSETSHCYFRIFLPFDMVTCPHWQVGAGGAWVAFRVGTFRHAFYF